jgi:preprotein translocase subunit SecE
MIVKLIEIGMIVVFVLALWGVDSIINKFENKNKTE